MSQGNFFEELAQILTQNASSEGKEQVSKQFVDQIVQPALSKFSDDQDLKDAAAQKAIDPISLFNLFTGTSNTASGTAQDKTSFLLETVKNVFNVKSEIPKANAEIPTIDADLTHVDNNQIWDVFSALNNVSQMQANSDQQSSAIEKLVPLIGTLLSNAGSNSTATNNTPAAQGGLNLAMLIQFAYQIWPQLKNSDLGQIGALVGALLGNQNDKSGNISTIVSAGLGLLGKFLKK